MRLVNSLLLVLIAATHSIADPAPKITPTPDEIREAIGNLDHEQYRVRTAAAKKLRAAGKNAMEPLVKVATSGSIESADRAMKILQDLAFNADDATMAAGRDALHQIARSKAPVRIQAREMINRYRGVIMDRLRRAGVRLEFDGEIVTSVYLEAVGQVSESESFEKLLPLLREFPEITEVSASIKTFGDKEMKYLLPLTKLKRLNLYQSNIGDESLKLLKNFPELEMIPMGETRVTDAGLKHLAELTQLDYIGLRGNNVTDAGLVHLKKLTNLTGLTLQESKVTGAGMAHLAPLTKLQSLRLQKTALTDEGMESLHVLKQLRYVNISGCEMVGADAATKLREAVPGVAVIANEKE